MLSNATVGGTSSDSSTIAASTASEIPAIEAPRDSADVSRVDPTPAIPVAGDDANAKQAVIDLIEQIGFSGIDAGTLAGTRRQQPGSPLYVAFADARRRQMPLRAARLRELLAAS